MAEQAIVGTEKNLPHGTEEGVPNRSGIGKEEGHPVRPTDDPLTDQRRAKYGQDPAFEMRSGESMPDIRIDVNQVKTPNNPTRDERIRGDNSDTGHETGYGRAMVA